MFLLRVDKYVIIEIERRFAGGRGCMEKLYVDEKEIQVIKLEENDYISLTDMVRSIENGYVLIEKWLRNKNTIEFLGIYLK